MGNSTTESGLPIQVFRSFLHGSYGNDTSLLLSTRPNEMLDNSIKEKTRWIVVEPRLLDESTLPKFINRYGGKELSVQLKAACRSRAKERRDEGYLPILVRMAMTLDDTSADKGLADIYRSYFLQIFKAQVPEEGELLKLLTEASQWYLQTYWKDGQRRRIYDASSLQQRLLNAGVLIPADGLAPPKEVQFFHDSM